MDRFRRALHPHRSHRELVDHLIKTGAVQTRRVAEALLAVDRRHFVRADPPEAVYDVSQGGRALWQSWTLLVH